MRYIFAIIVPPLGVALCKRWGHFVFNLILWIASFPLIAVLGIGFVTWFICVVHALIVCRMSSVDKRVDRMVAAMQQAQPPTNTQ